MKCDKTLNSLETGGWIKRRLARAHIRRCRNCAEDWRRLQRLQQEMAQAQPLTAHHRRRWEAAAGSQESLGGLLSWAPFWGLVGAVCTLVGVLGGAWMLYRGASPTQVTHDPSHQGAAKAPAPSELDALRRDLRKLSQELENLEAAASLLEERVQLEDLVSDNFGSR